MIDNEYSSIYSSDLSIILSIMVNIYDKSSIVRFFVYFESFKSEIILLKKKNGKENASSNVAGNNSIVSFYCVCSQCCCRNFLRVIYLQELLVLCHK